MNRLGRQYRAQRILFMYALPEGHGMSKSGPKLLPPALGGSHCRVRTEESSRRPLLCR
jgi:hypothetical protein